MTPNFMGPFSHFSEEREILQNEDAIPCNSSPTANDLVEFEMVYLYMDLRLASV